MASFGRPFETLLNLQQALDSYRSSPWLDGGLSGGGSYPPMNVFRDGDDYLFALTYGSDVQWVKNIMAAGEAEIRIGDKTIHLTDPELFVDPKRRLMPPPVRP